MASPPGTWTINGQPAAAVLPRVFRLAPDAGRGSKFVTSYPGGLEELVDGKWKWVCPFNGEVTRRALNIPPHHVCGVELTQAVFLQIVLYLETYVPNVMTGDCDDWYRQPK